MYDHKRKAGNRGDVWKHFWLCELVARLAADRSGKVSVLDTHCGAGVYRQDETEGWAQGIGRFGKETLASLGLFGKTLRRHLAEGRYLGSWLLVAEILADRGVDFSIRGCDVSADVGRAFVDGLSMGLGFTVVLLLLGTMREAVGFGTLLQQADLMFGEGARWLTITLWEDYRGYLLAILPPGAFIGLGLLIAIKNVLDGRLEKRRKAVSPAPVGAT